MSAPRNPICANCPFRHHPMVTYVPPSGSLDHATYAVFGEQPGENERMEGKPFVGASGQLLFKMLKRYGAERDGAYVSNACDCHFPMDKDKNPAKDSFPKEQQYGILEDLWDMNPELERRARDKDDKRYKRKVRLDELRRALTAQCGRKIQWELENLNANSVLALGTQGASGVFGEHVAVTRVRGFSWELDITDTRTINVISTFHPASLLYEEGARNFSTFRRDVRRFAYRQFDSVNLDEYVDTHMCRTWADVEVVVKNLENLARQSPGAPLAFDFETTGLDPIDGDLPTLVAFAISSRRSVVIPLYHEEYPLAATDPVRMRKLLQRVCDADFSFAAHNGKFDVKWFWLMGVYFSEDAYAYDSMAANHLIDENMGSSSEAGEFARINKGAGHNLNSVLATWTSWPKYDQVVVDAAAEPVEVAVRAADKGGKIQTRTKMQPRGYGSLPYDMLARYCGLDSCAVLEVAEVQIPQIDEQSWALFRDAVLPGTFVLARIEWNGILVDKSLGDRAEADTQAYLSKIAEEMFVLTESMFNPESNAQIGDLVYNKFGFRALPSEMTASGKPSTRKEVIERIAEDALQVRPAEDPGRKFLELLMKHRKFAKRKSTYYRGKKDTSGYLNNVSSDGRLRSTYNNSFVVTGRLSSSNPVNLQNPPREMDEDELEARPGIAGEVRRMFIVPPGHVFGNADISQAELKVAAHLAQEQNMLEAFARGDDVHALVARLMYHVPEGEDVTKQQRTLAKRVDFGTLYGAGASGLAKSARIDYGTAEETIAAFREAFPALTAWADEIMKAARTKRKIRNMYGRWRRFPEFGPMDSHWYRQAVNFPIQSTVADYMNYAIVDVDRMIWELDLKTLIIGQVHDSLMFQIPNEEVQSIYDVSHAGMVRPLPGTDFELSIDFEVGLNWQDTEKVILPLAA